MEVRFLGFNGVPEPYPTSSYNTSYGKINEWPLFSPLNDFNASFLFRDNYKTFTAEQPEHYLKSKVFLISS